MYMSFGFWFWQFDRSGAADSVMVTEISVVTTALGLFVQMRSINDVEVGVVRVGNELSKSKVSKGRIPA